jgi:hypothetical protein
MFPSVLGERFRSGVVPKRSTPIFSLNQESDSLHERIHVSRFKQHGELVIL